jgi:hypothetical protein
LWVPLNNSKTFRTELTAGGLTNIRPCDAR